jgi:hypothetical protein
MRPIPDPNVPTRLSSWREVIANTGRSPQQPGDADMTDELLAASLARLEAQTLQVLAAIDRNYIAVKAVVEQAGRTPDHQAYMENAGAGSIKTFYHHSATLQELAILGVVKVLRDVVTRPVIIHPPPERQPTRRRLLGR